MGAKRARKCALALVALLLLTPALAGGETLVISFLGDCSIGEAYQYKGYDNSYTDVIDKKGFAWPFSLVADTLESDDLTLANLEVVFTTRNKHADKTHPLCADPKYAGVLLESGIDAVNTANNHCFDFHAEGYDDTIETLDNAGINHFGSPGVGTSIARDKTLTMTVKGVRVGMIGFTYPNDHALPRLESRITALREDGCKLVIVSLHWGRETKDTPEAWQYTYARKLIDMGADVIWGHHPHVLQQVHFYKDKPIFYSTGNFTFGTMSNVDRNTGIFQLTYDVSEDGDPSLYRFSVVPCKTSGAGDYRAHPLSEEEDILTMRKRLVFRKTIKGMTNLPASFLETGYVQFELPVNIEDYQVR